MQAIDVRSRGRSSLERRAEKALEAVDPAELAREEEVGRCPPSVESRIAQPLGEKYVGAQKTHLMPTRSRHFRWVAARHHGRQTEARVRRRCVDPLVHDGAF